MMKLNRDNVETTILALIHNNPKGITIAELKAETNLSEPQIWAVVFPAEKMGRIKIIKQGLYVDT